MNRSFRGMDATVDPGKAGQAIIDLIAQATADQIKKATGTPTGYYNHGPGGLFGVRGLSAGIISTATQITGSLAEEIPVAATNAQRDIQTNAINPLFPFITGFLRSDQQEKNAICDDPIQAAGFKTCIQTAVFGRKEAKTRTIEINHVGQTINRGEFTDLTLLNPPLVEGMAGLLSNFLGIRDQAQALSAGRDMVMRFVEVAVDIQRWFCPQVYTGHPANSSAGGGYKEFAGLDLLISTTKIDALSGAACPSLYSDVKDFSYRQISSTTDPDIHRTLSTMMYILERRAVQQNLNPVSFAIVMRSQLFWELCRYWPLAYNTDAMGTSIAGLDMLYMENIKLRDAMRAGSFLIVNGKQYRVIQDDCIDEDNRNDNAAIPIGGFASDIYIVPFSARGGSIQSLYWEYFDYRKGALPTVNDARANAFFWSDDGIFLWGVRPPNNWCVDVITKFEPRLILRTPQLAGRLMNVSYVPLQHTNDPLPSQMYHVNGGVATGRPGPSPYSEWNLGGPGFGN